MTSKLNSKLLGTLTAIATVSASFLIAQMTAQAHHRFVDDVGRQLLRVAVASDLGGYDLTHDPFIDSVGDGQSDYITLNLRAGKSYGIVGVCDRDCSDIDLKLYDGSGNFIDSDIQSDDTPVVTVNPRWSGRYSIKVNMVSCNQNPCYYGVCVFGQ